MNVTRTASGITVELELNEAETLTFAGLSGGPTQNALVAKLTEALASEPPSLVGGKAIYPWGRK